MNRVIRFYQISEGHSIFGEMDPLTPQQCVQAIKCSEEHGTMIELYLINDPGSNPPADYDGTPMTGLIFEGGRFTGHGLGDPRFYGPFPRDPEILEPEQWEGVFKTLLESTDGADIPGKVVRIHADGDTLLVAMMDEGRLVQSDWPIQLSFVEVNKGEILITEEGRKLIERCGRATVDDDNVKMRISSDGTIEWYTNGTEASAPLSMVDIDPDSKEWLLRT